jgi:hypothetical protein
MAMADPVEMPDLPKKLKKQGWRVKIRKDERVEPPHVTIIRSGGDEWRLGLRDWELLVPPGGKWRDLDVELRRFLEDEGVRSRLRAVWDQRYPSNPIESPERAADDEAKGKGKGKGGRNA